MESQSKLAAGYPGIGGGYDSMVISGLGLQPEAVREFIASKKPSYPQFESWIKSQPGVKLDSASVKALNDSITGYIHSDETRSGIFSANGLCDSDTAARDAVNLNNLDDWHEFHQSVLK